MKAYIGIDAGKINTKVIVIDDNKNIIYKIITPSRKIISSIKYIFKKIKDNIPPDYEIYNIGVSGENRFIVGKFLGTDTIINEIECLKEYAIENNIEGNILEIGSDNYKVLRIKDNSLSDYHIYKSSNTITINFIYKVSNLLKIDIDSIELKEESINFKNDNLILLYDEIKSISHNVNKDIIISSLIKKMLNNLPPHDHVICSKNNPMFKYLNAKSDYIIALGASYLSKRIKSKKIYDLNIENNTIERIVESCHKCHMNCEIVSIYRNNELIDAFGNKCNERILKEYNKAIYYM